MRASDVLSVLSALTGGGVAVWIDGGWGVDALLGEQHREHGDLDLVLELDHFDHVMDVLAQSEYVLADDLRPTRAVLTRSDGCQIDLHLVTFDSEGCGWQKNATPDGGDCAYPKDGFTTGVIAGVRVPCLDAIVQLDHHLGYEPRTHDRDDMLRLVTRFGLTAPPPYAK